MQLSPIPTLHRRLAVRGLEVLPGALVCVGIAVLATAIGRAAPVLGSAIPAVAMGVAVACVRRPSARLRPGVAYAGKFLLQCAVVLLGAQLSLASVVAVGLESLPVMIGSLLVCLVAAWTIGRSMGVERDLRVLIGVGTGICGASAIAAVSPVIRARSSDVSYAISTVFLFNIIAIAAFPAIGHALGMSPHAFGLLAGTAVNDTSSVVAAASVFSSAALGFAVVVKLVRTLMIIPVSVGLAILEARRSDAGDRMTPVRLIRLVPWFLIGFLAVAAISSTGAVPPPAIEALTRVSVFLVATALAGIGLSTDLGAIRIAGLRPLVLGGILSLLVLTTTLGLMAVTGRIS